MSVKGTNKLRLKLVVEGDQKVTVHLVKVHSYAVMPL